MYIYSINKKRTYLMNMLVIVIYTTSEAYWRSLDFLVGICIFKILGLPHIPGHIFRYIPINLSLECLVSFVVTKLLSVFDFSTIAIYFM